MATNMKLVLSIINFLKEESKRETLTPDTQESLEVAVQCLQTAYDLDSNDARLNQKAKISLEDIFNSVEMDENSTEDQNKAVLLKNLGNNLMKKNNYVEAVSYYTNAIKLDSQNAIYYGNRAAAYSKLHDFNNAIKDCEKAIELDPSYAKAYGRMGLAHTSLLQYDDAVAAFVKALELDPDNASYKSNLKYALEQKDNPDETQSNPSPNINWNSIFSNPSFRNMASTLMQDQNIINALSAGMHSLNQPPSDGGGDTGATGLNPNNRSFDMLVEAGQYLATQMHAANPELVEQFRQTTTRNPNPPNPDNNDPQ